MDREEEEADQLKLDEGIQRVKDPTDQNPSQQVGSESCVSRGNPNTKRRQRVSGLRDRASTKPSWGRRRLDSRKAASTADNNVAKSRSAHRGLRAGHADKDSPGTWEIPSPPSKKRLGSRRPNPRPAGADAVPSGSEQGEQTEPLEQGKRGEWGWWEVGAPQ